MALSGKDESYDTEEKKKKNSKVAGQNKTQNNKLKDAYLLIEVGILWGTVTTRNMLHKFSPSISSTNIFNSLPLVNRESLKAYLSNKVPLKGQVLPLK